ncbi:hypothetical protein RF11_10981 [Thelohanellus kitauei]|uniref:Uncharacterized protein n=1 Tax=Thelohanellus kitauei TaxID=669202 RepID=A0A0C2I786_THEKT|nr:hypothetical protein RF11_10981 [Thelohanellus kitauei]
MKYVHGQAQYETQIYNALLGSTSFTVEYLFEIKYLDSVFLNPRFQHYFKGPSLKNLCINDSGLFIKFEGFSEEWAEFRCNLSNFDSEIEIKECLISFKLDAYFDIVSFPVGYIFKLNKKTKYVFSDHRLRIWIVGKIGHRIYVNLTSLLITFPGYIRTYHWKVDYQRFIDGYLPSSTLIDDFAKYGGSYSNESDPSNQVKAEETPAEFKNKFLDRSAFWISKNMLFVFGSLVVIIIFLVIFVIIKCCRRSPANK